MFFEYEEAGFVSVNGLFAPVDARHFSTREASSEGRGSMKPAFLQREGRTSTLQISAPCLQTPHQTI